MIAPWAPSVGLALTVIEVALPSGRLTVFGELQVPSLPTQEIWCRTSPAGPLVRVTLTT